jgi:hypothetical protein
VDADVSRLLAPVLRDVAACGGLVVRVEEGHRPPAGLGPDDEMVMVWTPDGSGTGILVDEALPDHQQQALVADEVHEAVVEGRWSAGLSTSWPPCPWHPDSHPLEVRLRDTDVVWACPRGGRAVCPVGQLDC